MNIHRLCLSSFVCGDSGAHVSWSHGPFPAGKSARALDFVCGSGVLPGTGTIPNTPPSSLHSLEVSWPTTVKIWSSSSKLSYQVYLISGIVRWNSDRSSDAVYGGKGRRHSSYSASLLARLNTRCQQLFGETVEENLRAPAAMMTNELLGLEYLFSQSTGESGSFTLDNLSSEGLAEDEEVIQVGQPDPGEEDEAYGDVVAPILSHMRLTSSETSETNPPAFEDICSSNPLPGYRQLEIFCSLLVDIGLNEERLTLTSEQRSSLIDAWNAVEEYDKQPQRFNQLYKTHWGNTMYCRTKREDLEAGMIQRLKMAKRYAPAQQDISAQNNRLMYTLVKLLWLRLPGSSQSSPEKKTDCESLREDSAPGFGCPTERLHMMFSSAGRNALDGRRRYDMCSDGGPCSPWPCAPTPGSCNSAGWRILPEYVQSCDTVGRREAVQKRATASAVTCGLKQRTVITRLLGHHSGSMLHRPRRGCKALSLLRSRTLLSLSSVDKVTSKKRKGPFRYTQRISSMRRPSAPKATSQMKARRSGKVPTSSSALQQNRAVLRRPLPAEGLFRSTASHRHPGRSTDVCSAPAATCRSGIVLGRISGRLHCLELIIVFLLLSYIRGD
ncbi:uncharacterized protein [Paramormyrops kingsleyae]|uniref:uncharacterized protein n=1 Tax=Paramormyrops kingsleyae TaxID=1676925 RepID=UPI003B96F8EE